jgi:hypothetical protein
MGLGKGKVSKPYDKMLIRPHGFVEDFVDKPGKDDFSVWTMYFSVANDALDASVNYMFTESLSKARSVSVNRALVGGFKGYSISEGVLGDGFGGPTFGTPIRKIPPAPLNWLSKHDPMAIAKVGFAKINAKDKTFIIRFWMDGVTAGFMLTFRGLPDSSYLNESRSGVLSEFGEFPPLVAYGF